MEENPETRRGSEDAELNCGYQPEVLAAENCIRRMKEEAAVPD